MTTPGELDRWARLARDGDGEAFGLLARAVAPQLQRIAWRILGDGMLAADAVQETLLKAARGLGRYDPSRPVLPWLRRIAGRAALDLWRRETVAPLVELEQAAALAAPESQQPDQELAALESQELLQRLTAVLTPQQRAVFVMRDLEEMTTAEIAAALDLSESTVRVHLARARERVREEWRRHVAKEASR